MESILKEDKIHDTINTDLANNKLTKIINQIPKETTPLNSTDSLVMDTSHGKNLDTNCGCNQLNNLLIDPFTLIQRAAVQRKAHVQQKLICKCRFWDDWDKWEISFSEVFPLQGTKAAFTFKSTKKHYHFLHIFLQLDYVMT